MKFKIAVTVFLQEDGNIGIQTTSKNQITTLGLLEAGKAVLLTQLQPSEESRIVVPEL